MHKITNILLGVIAIILLALLGKGFIDSKIKNQIPEGQWVCLDGEWIMQGLAKEPKPIAKCEKKKIEPNITVEEPKPGQKISSPVTIQGQAKNIFENQFNYRIRDENGKVLAEGSNMTANQEMTQYSPYNTTAEFMMPEGEKGIIEVFDRSAADGTEVDKITIPVVFAESISKSPTSSVKIFFSNNKKDTDLIECDKVYEVSRIVTTTQAIGKATLEELLNGPTAEEKKLGYVTSINPKVKIQKLTIEKGTATIDFDETLQKGVGGSCRITTIKTQIIETLKQFETVKNVIISINGNTEDILQP